MYWITEFAFRFPFLNSLVLVIFLIGYIAMNKGEEGETEAF